MSTRAPVGRNTFALLAPLAMAVLVVAAGTSYGAEPYEGTTPGTVAAPQLVASSTDGHLDAALPSAFAPPATPELASSLPVLLPEPSAQPPMLRLDGPPPPAFAAGAMLLLDDGSGAVLRHDSGHTSLPPASLTKIATAALVLESEDLDAWVTVDVDSRTMRGSTVMGLVPGDRFTVRDLLYGLMLPSGNDAALALGRHVAGSDAAFVERMNALAARLGLTETRFANAHGLNAPGHVASARDIALLTRYAMSLPAFREIAGTQYWEAVGPRTIALYNVAGGSLRMVAGADAVKSGFTRQAGRTLVLSATRDGHRLYAVILNDPQREADAARLLNWAFAAYDWDAEPPAVSAATTAGG